MAGSIRTKQRLSDTVAQALQEDILGLTTGDRLPTEAELVERFGVSRTVVREATRLLVQRGLATVSPGRGMTVAAVDGSVIAEQYGLLLRLGGGSFEELMELRLVLEVEMAALAAARRTPAQLAELNRLNERLQAADPAGKEFLEADLTFHETDRGGQRQSLLPAHDAPGEHVPGRHLQHRRRLSVRGRAHRAGAPRNRPRDRSG